MIGRNKMIKSNQYTLSIPKFSRRCVHFFLSENILSVMFISILASAAK